MLTVKSDTSKPWHSAVYLCDTSEGLKRFTEICLASVGLIFSMPLLTTLAMMIKIDSGGPVMIMQRRVGRNGELFNCYKLRTMANAAPVGPTHTVDPSHITRFGKVLRGTGLDELPQLWNILNGSMSFVGPRPCLPSQSSLIARREHKNVFSVRPGITGLAQSSGVDMSKPRLLTELDATYITEKSLSFDLKIVLRTVSLLLRKTLGGH